MQLISDTSKTHVIGCPMNIFSVKRKMLKGKLKTWNHETFSIIPDFIKEGQKDLQDIQGQIQTSGYNENFGTLEKNAQIRIEDALKRQN